jgi:predicted nucleotidyltransferase component of viral defense system
MELKSYYNKLYKLQDKVLEVVFKNSNEFYLTGGTCLNRFYINARYSDDLDFFTNSSRIFNFEIKRLKVILEEKFNLKTEIESKDFIRWKIENLKIDFVNDVSKYCSKVVIKENLILDNIENICANKFLAILGRDEAKDVFDLYLIDKYFKPNYKKIVDCAKEKAIFNIEDLIYRLKTFPKSWIKKLNLVDEKYEKEFNLDFINSIQKEVL